MNILFPSYEILTCHECGDSFDSLSKFHVHQVVHLTKRRGKMSRPKIKQLKATTVFIFDNGNIAVTDQNGEQMPDLQDPWINYDALKKLAEVIATDRPEIRGSFPLKFDPLRDYVSFYEKHPNMETKS